MEIRGVVGWWREMMVMEKDRKEMRTTIASHRPGCRALARVTSRVQHLHL